MHLFPKIHGFVLLYVHSFVINCNNTFPEN